MNDLLGRAFSAYFARAAREGWIPDQPANYSDVREVDGREYVVLENVRGVLAVYRVRTNGRLKYLRRWPRELARS
jgi:hypothetical protein